MIPADVCDGQEQGRSTLYGREVDRTTRFGGKQRFGVNKLFTANVELTADKKMH